MTYPPLSDILAAGKVRIVVNGWFWDQMTTGSGQYLAALAAVLPRVGAGDEWIVALRRADRTAQLPGGLRSIIIETPLSRVSSNLAKVWFEQISFPRLCRRLSADVGFVPYWGSPWWRPCAMAVTVHDLIPLLLPLYRGGFLQRLYTRLVSLTARRAAAVITDSEASRRDIVAHLRIPADRVHAVYLAAQGVGEQVGAESQAQLRARLNLPAGAFLLYLGGFDVRKNVPRTLQGYAQLVGRCRVEGRDAPALVIAGKLPAVDSPFAPDPRPVVEALGIAGLVHFVGWMSEGDKAALYRLAAAVLFVSEYEGFGLPVLEAMACDAGRADASPTAQVINGLDR